MDLLSSQRGFSLIQAMLLTGVLAAMGVGGTKLIATQKTAQKTSESRSDLETLHSLVLSTLQDKNNCSINFEVGKPVTDISEIRFFPSGKEFNEHYPKIIDQNDTYLAGAVKLKPNHNEPAKDGLRVEFENSDPLRPIGITIVYLQQRDNSKAKEIEKFIPIRFNLDSNGNFEDCYMDDLAFNTSLHKDFCTLPGMNNFLQWNETERSCEIMPRVCGSGELFQGFDEKGVQICRNLKDVVPLTEIFDTNAGTCVPVKSDAVRLVVDATTKKIKIVCSTPTCVPSCPATSTYCPSDVIADGCGGTCKDVGTKNCSSYAKCVFIDTQVNPPENEKVCVGGNYTTSNYNILDSSDNVVDTCINEMGHPDCKNGEMVQNCPNLPGCP